ncbi:hypothetical protein Q5752_006687 [Cryptotrichosporon argae]
MPGRVLVSIGVDVDAVAGWLGSYGGEDSPNDISRGIFAGTVGTRRLLKLFKKYGIQTTWFIPGHSLDTFPEDMAAVRDAGHEIGLHGYSHENPTAMTVEQQRTILNHTMKQLTEFCGKPPVGSVAPWWEVSKEGCEMLLDAGILYGHNSMEHDCQPFYARDADFWTPIDYAQPAETWMKPLVKGKVTGMVEIPASWDLDDLPPLMFSMLNGTPRHGFVDVRSIEQKWKDMFTYFYREERENGFCFPLTIHPDVSGKPHVILMLERFIEWVNTHDGVEWVPMIEIAKDFRERNPAPTGAAMPRGLA